jgi:hypothetical protein
VSGVDRIVRATRDVGDQLTAPWPPPGYRRDTATGREWRATEAELREANRLHAKYRDIAKPGANHDWPLRDDDPGLGV